MATAEEWRPVGEPSAGSSTSYRRWKLPPPGRHEMLPFLLTFADSWTEKEFDALWRREAVARDREFLRLMEVVTGLALARVCLQGAGWEYLFTFGVALLVLLTSRVVRRALGDGGVVRWRVTLVLVERFVATILHSSCALRLGSFQDISGFEFLMTFLNISGVANQATISLGLGLKFIYFPIQLLGSLWYMFLFANDTCAAIMQGPTSARLVLIVNSISKCCSVCLGSWNVHQPYYDSNEEYHHCQHLFVGLHLILAMCLTGFVIWEKERRGRGRFLAEKLARGEMIVQEPPPFFDSLGYPTLVALGALTPLFVISVAWFLGGACGELIAKHGWTLVH